MGIYLMAKNTPVLEIEDGSLRVLQKELLPFAIRKEHVTIEDFYGSWISSRAMQISRTNSKMILNSMRISQGNPYAICKACHALSLTDMYWIKEGKEPSTWEDVNLFQNPISRGMASTALTGDSLRETGKIHTPELTAQGVAAKAWIRENGTLYLYKVGKKELAASAILDALHFSHVSYEKVPEKDLQKVVTPKRKELIDALDEVVVKCKLITAENRSMTAFEDFQLYCENHGTNGFREALNLDRQHYLEMQIADYILNNIDRHGANWGFFMDNTSGELLEQYPLLDHDQAFSDVEGMNSQTTEEIMGLEAAALLAQAELKADLTAILKMKCPEGINAKQWQGVKARASLLQSNYRIYENLLSAGYDPDFSMIDRMRLLEEEEIP